MAMRSRWRRSYKVDQVASLFGSFKLAIIHGVLKMAMQCLYVREDGTTTPNLDIPG